MALNYDASTGILKVNTIQNEAGSAAPILPVAAYVAGSNSGETFSGTSLTNFRSYSPSSATITVTLDTNWFAGREVIIQNTGTVNLISLQASDTSVIATVYPGTTYRCIPTTTGANTQSQWVGLTPIISGWLSYTPSFGSTLGTPPTNISFFYKRMGKDFIVSGYATTGSPILGQPASISILSGLTLDTANLTISGNTTSATGSLVGFYATAQVGANTNGNLATAPGTSNSVVYFTAGLGNALSHTAPSLNAGSNVISANTDFTVNFTVPISGWTAFKG
jgi:hypothetical protein